MTLVALPRASLTAALKKYSSDVPPVFGMWTNCIALKCGDIEEGCVADRFATMEDIPCMCVCMIVPTLHRGATKNYYLRSKDIVNGSHAYRTAAIESLN